jgi:catechol 2,3-dioxygenase-like lactoylglutathione lyase family enzyme
MKVLAHVDLLVRDMTTSLAFYVDRLGCEVVEDTIMPGGPMVDFCSRGAARDARVVFLKPGAIRMAVVPLIELIEYRPKPGSTIEVRHGSAAGELPSILNFTLLVEDLPAVVDGLRAAGVEVTDTFRVELPRLGTCNVVFLRDPDGNLIELIEGVV